MKFLNLLAILSTLLIVSVQAGTFVNDKSENVTLVLVDTWATLETHSMFFDHIKQMGGGNHTLQFKLITGSPTDTVNIQQFNKYFYDNIILMAPTVKSFGSDLKVKELLEFVDFHHNIMIFVNNESRKTVRELANEFGVDFEDYGYTMQGGAKEGTTQSAFKMKNVSWSKNMFEPITGEKNIFSKLDRPVLFEDGVGQILDSETNNQHVFPILRADQGAYSYNPAAPERKETGIISGNQLTLVSAYQTRYNQRVVISGSTKMCGNDAMLANRDPSQDGSIKTSPNYVLCTEMVEWNLMERGVLRMDNIKHYKAGNEWDGNYPENYKRMVDIEYFADFQIKENGKWIPFVSDDIQFQFTMLDPYYQVPLEQVGKLATYTYKFKTPWRLGIFKFVVDYKRYGLSYIDSAMEVSVIQLRHDEFPRYETTGYPYFAAVFVLMGSSFMFVIHFAFSDFSKVKGVKTA